MLKKACLVIVALAVSMASFSMSADEYVQKFKDCAVEQMLVYNIPASITLAQGMLESDYGNSPLARYANNHFGIKCHEDWNGDYYTYDDDLKGEHFRKYSTVDESFRDHASFLKSRPWYSFLFHYPRNDYYDWAMGLSRAGYATAHDYSERLISIIKENDLERFDTVLHSLQGFGVLYDVPPVVENCEPTTEYVVLQQGDGIYKISREYCVDVNTLCRLNGINIHTKLVPGQKLYLRPKFEHPSGSFNYNNKKGFFKTMDKGVAVIRRRKRFLQSYC
jgi:hypothetical protein